LTGEDELARPICSGGSWCLLCNISFHWVEGKTSVMQGLQGMTKDEGQIVTIFMLCFKVKGLGESDTHFPTFVVYSKTKLPYFRISFLSLDIEYRFFTKICFCTRHYKNWKMIKNPAGKNSENCFKKSSIYIYTYI
jgi:hypothetical protein